ncbi:hypothetical protein CHS0354_037773 [Potamilus streckersoni]|uniref:Uncharacterized protein n=1 Tax=Potamilus streckersoni TaxID=2493646 RepID=A0AAE0T3P7_9BIVA|nr:hypothetical protein CHS0354_037773 [Potamilus streckersoni]
MRLNRNKIVVCVLSISVVLQVVAFLTPGWMVFTTNSRSEYQGLLYKVVCLSKGECFTTSALNENASSGVWFQGISFIIKCLLPLILSAAALVLQIISMRQPKKKSQNYVSCLICATMSVVLQWDLVFSHTFLPQERDNASTDFIFPWCRTMEAICGACSIGCSLLFMIGLRKALKAYETALQSSTENANDVTEDETKVLFEC